MLGFVGCADAVAETGGRRVVLDDVVVPVEDPDVAVRADFGHDRRAPFVAAGDEVHRAVRTIAGAIPLEHEHADEVARRLGDERRAIPPLLRIGAGRVDGLAGAGRVGVEVVDLPDFVRDGRELRRVGDLRSVSADQPGRARSSGSGWA